MPQLPKLTHVQFAVLGSLAGGNAVGRDIRKHLADAFKFRQSGPAFYQMMARMEDAGLVEGWYEQQIVAAQIIRERHYKITALGRRSWNETRRFYASFGKTASTGLAHG